jgi:hypothetical protein
MPGEQEKTQEELQADQVKVLEAAGYSADEIEDLSQAEIDAILSKPEPGDGDDDEEEGGGKGDLSPEELAKIAAEKGETDEEKAAREAKEKAEADKGKTPEQLAEEKRAADDAAKGEVLDDDALMDVEVRVSNSELPALEKILEEAAPAIKAKLAELDTALTTLDAKYDEGDMKLPDYNRERDKINRQIMRAEDEARDAAKDGIVWAREQQIFFRNKPEYLKAKDASGKFTEPDEDQERKDAMFSTLGATVQKLQADAKYQHLSGIALLLEADKRVRKVFGVKPKDKKAAAPAADDKASKPPAPKPGHKTLADVPAAAANSTGDPFAEVDKLTGEAFEAAIERMTPAQKAEYERRA